MIKQKEAQDVRLSKLIKTGDFVPSQFIEEISSLSNAKEMYEIVKQ